MERNEAEALRFFCPLSADELPRGQFLEGLDPPAEVVGGKDMVQGISEPDMIVVVTALDRGFLDWAVHSFSLAIAPRMHRLRQPVLNVETGACRIERMATEYDSFCPHLFNSCRPVAVERGPAQVFTIRRSGGAVRLQAFRMAPQSHLKLAKAIRSPAAETMRGKKLAKHCFCISNASWSGTRIEGQKDIAPSEAPGASAKLSVAMGSRGRSTATHG